MFSTVPEEEVGLILPGHLLPETPIDGFKKIFSRYSFDIVTNINKFFETFYICKLVIDTNNA